MDALSTRKDFKGPAKAMMSVVLLLALGGAAPFAYMSAPIDRPFEAGSEVTYVWADMSPMALPRASPQVLALPGGDILVTGGQSSFGPTETTEVYDPETDSWRRGPSMNIARVGHTATLLADGTVLVTGGETGSGTSSSAEIIDLAKNACLYVGSMSFARSGHAAALLPDGRVLVAGGTDWLHGVWSQAEAYDPVSHTFRPAGSMASQRLFMTVQTLPDGRVMAIGGDAAATSEMFDPRTNSWGSVSQMQAKRYSASSVLLESEDVMVAGGVAGDTVLSSVEAYSAAYGIWLPVERMSEPRANFGLAPMANGRIVATGSWSSLGATGSCDSMCPCAGTWRAEDPLGRPRGMHGTANTANGSVLAIGGRNGVGPLSSVEMLVEVRTEPPTPSMCQPIDLLPLVLAVADELRGFSENGLIAKLIVAQAAYELGDLDLSLRLLDAFYRQVRAFHDSGHLGDEGATMLYEGYAEVVECLGGSPLPPLA